jgi:translation initiation factor 2 alpha subunit (eIF-2alpha)
MDESLIKCRFYENIYPNVGDRVVFEFVKLEDSLVRIKLLEYEDYPAMILLTDLTRMKNVNSLQKLCPIGNISVGEVLSTELKVQHAGADFASHAESDDQSMAIYVSVKNIPKNDQADYMTYYNKSKKLLNFMKRISTSTKTPLLDVCKKISWPLYHVLEQPQHPLDYIDHPDKIKLLCLKNSRASNLNVQSSDGVLADQDQQNICHNTENETAFDEAEADTKEDETEPVNPFTLDNDTARLLLLYHESMFGKQTRQKSIKMGIISYAMEGLAIIKLALSDLKQQFNDKFPELELTILLRDLPIYEFKVKGVEAAKVDEVAIFIVNHFQNRQNLLFKHISTK